MKNDIRKRTLLDCVCVIAVCYVYVFFSFFFKKEDTGAIVGFCFTSLPLPSLSITFSSLL